MLPRPVAAQLFEMVTRRKPQILELLSGIKCRKHGSYPFDQICRETFAKPVSHRIGGAFAFDADDHEVLYHDVIHPARALVVAVSRTVLVSASRPLQPRQLSDHEPSPLPPRVRGPLKSDPRKPPAPRAQALSLQSYRGSHDPLSGTFRHPFCMHTG